MSGELDQYINNIGYIILQINAQGIVTRINQKGCDILGYSKDEIIGKNWFDNFLPEKNRHEIKKVFTQLIKENKEATEYYRNPILNNKGEERLIAWHNTQIRDESGHIVSTLSSGEDITETLLSEKKLRESEFHFRILFEESPISLWEEDFSEVKKYFNALKKQGIDDIRQFFHKHPDEIRRCASMVRIIDVNKATLRLYHMKDIDVLRQGLAKVFGEDSYPIFSNELIALAEGKIVFESEAINRTIHDEIINIRIKVSVPPGYEDTLSKVFVSIIDITQQVSMIKEKEKLYRKLLDSHSKLRKMALMDSHTGLYNHWYFGEVIQREYAKAKRYHRPLSIIMLDLDYFKSINDVYGHLFGDLVLKQLAQILKKNVREYDSVIRFGGEEFIIISPELNRLQAFGVAEKLHNIISLYNFGNQKVKIKLKVSLAIASYPEDNIHSHAHMLEVVDNILTKAKEDGGDRIYNLSDLKQKNRNKKSKNTKYDISEITSLKHKINKLTARAHQSLIEAIFAFARTIKIKDQYTGEHVESTVQYAKSIGLYLGLAKEEIELVREAAILHDLGKIGVSDKILMKKGKLSHLEFNEIKKHPEIAVDIIRPIHFLHAIIPFILYHHERWDGKGYPFGLKGEEIPLGARIIALADTYQALISKRPYHKAYSKNDAKKIIEKESGTKFDPKVVEAFLRIGERKKKTIKQKFPPKRKRKHR